MSKYREMQAQCCEVNMEIPRRNLAIFTLGNVSAADHREGVFAIKPSGIAYDELRPKDIVVCDFDGQLIEGLLNPSSDTPTHADHCACDIPCTPPMSDEAIEGNYEVETGYQIVNHFAEKGLNHREVEMVLVGSHGPNGAGNPHREPPNTPTQRCADPQTLPAQTRPRCILRPVRQLILAFNGAGGDAGYQPAGCEGGKDKCRYRDDNGHGRNFAPFGARIGNVERNSHRQSPGKTVG